MNNQLKNTLDRMIDDKVEKLSAEICSKLNQSRQTALKQAKTTAINPLFWLAPLAASLMFSIYVIMPLNNKKPTSTPSNLTNNLTVNNAFNSIDDVDLAEDLDFYLWLAQDKSINI